MFDSIAYTVPANTLAVGPLSYSMRLDVGTLTRVGLQFPTGCAGLLRAQVWYGGFQLYPRTPASFIASDGQTIWLDDEYDIPDRALLLTLKVWNIDDTYPHTITWYVQATQRRLNPPPAAAQPNPLQQLRSALGL